MSTWALVLAAGKGERAKLGSNKVFFTFDGRSVLNHCLDVFEQCHRFDGIVLVIARADQQMYDELCENEGRCPLVKKVVYGGSSRRESVYNGLQALPEDTEIVAIHDAARPFVNDAIIKATIESAKQWGSGVISTAVTDTIKQIMPDGSVYTPDRNSLRAVQTPQTFEYKKLMQAHRQAAEAALPATDDAMLFEHYYGTVHLVTAEGAQENQKLTMKADFEALTSQFAPQIRIGQGYDAHRLKEGRKLVLCGVEIPHKMGLDGHSDADVAVHALMDAMLGAMAVGDIGRLFPDSDMQFKDISSMLLLKRVVERIEAMDYRVGNVDVTIVAQKPKLMVYMPQMRQNIAEALKVAVDCVNVKATTTERMGFEGEELGISAQAVALMIHK